MPDRRASLVPSTYSTTSSASFYSPHPDASPAVHNAGRLPAGLPNPAPPNRAQSASRAGYTAYPEEGLTAAQAYQASTGYPAPHSPAMSTFPHRGNASNPSFAQSTDSYDRSTNTSRSPSSLQGDVAKDRIASPPPDYINALSALNFDGNGSGPLLSLIHI